MRDDCPECDALTWPVYRPASLDAYAEERIEIEGLGWCPACEQVVGWAPVPSLSLY